MEEPREKKQKMDEQKTCKHFVTRKKRFCKMTVAKGKEYCGEHEPQKQETVEELTECDRIPCPLDGKHSVYRKNLNKHLRICNAKPKTDLPDYIQPGVNAGESDDEGDVAAAVDLKLSEIPKEELDSLIEKLEKLYEENVKDKIKPFKNQCHEILREELQNEHYGKESKKHLIQTAAILKVLEEEGFIRDSTSFIEFGAGKGQLSCWLVKLLETYRSSQIVLVDRASLRHKKDNKLENEEKDKVHRIRADISDLLVDKLDILKSSKTLVGLSKHLCGAATDLTLRCILKNEALPRTDGIFIALCCHHRCEWKSFVGKKFFLDHLLSKKDFVLITKMASYAICGTGMSRERRKLLEANGNTSEENSKVKITAERREEIGIMCKRLLDYARLEFMRGQGFDGDLKFYVGSDVTLENVALVLKRK